MTCPGSHSVWGQAGIRYVLPSHMPVHHPLTLPVLEEKDLSFASVSGPQESQNKHGERTCLSRDGPLSLPWCGQYWMNTWIPDLKHCCNWGVWKWTGQVSQIWRGKKYIFAWLFTSEVTKQESGGQNLVGCLASFLGSLRLRIIAFQHLSWIRSEFFPLSYHCQAERRFPKIRLKLRGENKALSEFLGPGDRCSDRCGKRNTLCLSLSFYFLSAKEAEKSCHVPETQAGSVSSCL